MFLRKSKPFIWMEEAEEAFQELKRYLPSPLIMVAPKPGEPLLLYIMAIANAMSMVLAVERLEPFQHQEPEFEEAPRSRALEAHPAPKLGDGTDTVIEFHPPDADLGAGIQEVTES
jgi:hypothetical protein